MRALFFLLIGSFWMMAPLSWVSVGRCGEVVVDSDLGVLRIKNSVYLLSDLLSLAKSFDQLNCLVPHSFVSRAIAFPENMASILLQVQESNKKKYLPYFEKILNMIKMIMYVQEQGTTVPEQFIWNVIKENLQNSCVGDKAMASKNLRNLLQVENYLRARFEDSNFWASEAEVIQYKAQQPEMPEEQIKQSIKIQKIGEALKMFLGFLERKFYFEWI